MEPWLKIYDANYLDKNVFGGVEKHLPAVCSILRYIEKKSTGKVVSHLSRGKTG
jgi:hypothetical protein